MNIRRMREKLVKRQAREEVGEEGDLMNKREEE